MLMFLRPKKKKKGKEKKENKKTDYNKEDKH